jgi:hypothetical protein
MLVAEQIRKIKQNNVSVDSGLTKQRVKESFKSASKQQKIDIETLSGLKRVSIQRVYATGSISAKIAIAFAQTLNIDPAYLTGEAAKSGECTNETLAGFLTAKGYEDLAKAAGKPPRKARGTAAKEKKGKKAPAPVVPVAIEPPAAPEPQAPIPPDDQQEDERLIQSMSEDEAVQLLRALYLRVQFDPDLKHTLKAVQDLLFWLFIPNSE